MKLNAHVSTSCSALLFFTILTFQCSPAWSQSNLVVNGSFEQLAEGWSPSDGYKIATYGNAAMGKNYALMTSHLWQDISCEVGKDYYVKFALKHSTYDITPTVSWGTQQLVLTSMAGATNVGWYYAYAYVHADATPTQLRFEQTGFLATNWIAIDDVTVADANEEVQILAQPQSRTIYTNYSASFTVIAEGAPPLQYQWYYNDSPLPATKPVLYRSSSSPGNYYVVVSNPIHSVTSSIATLTVQDLPQIPQITAQPLGGSAPVGGNFTFRVSAIGVNPLCYQWRLNGQGLLNKTNPALSLYNLQTSNAGDYSVVVSNQNGFVISWPVTLNVMATVSMSTNGYIGLMSSNSPVYDSDGLTKLAGTNYVLGAFIGTNEFDLRTLGWTPLGTGYRAGVGGNWIMALMGIPPFTTIFAQMRCWDSRLGNYEAARAQGGKYGFSPVYTMQTGTQSAATFIPMTSFAVHDPSSDFWTGRLEAVTNSSDGLIYWRLTGETGFRYLIESQTPPQEWTPYLVLTNDIGSVTFVTTNEPSAPVTFYRSRILE